MVLRLFTIYWVLEDEHNRKNCYITYWYLAFQAMDSPNFMNLYSI